MRLLKEHQHQIKDFIAKLDPEAEIHLYGSRMDDNAKGGDYDFLIFSKIIDETDHKTKIRLALYDILGEQHIDVTLAKDCSTPFVKYILEKGTCKL